MNIMFTGQSGSGKTSILRNMPLDKIAVFNVAGKPLPFKGKIPAMFTTHDVNSIIASLRRNNFNCYIIDDSQYLMSFKLIDKINETGYAKYTEIAKDFKRLIDVGNTEVSPDTIVYFLHHIEVTEDGFKKAKTTGKMIDNWLTLEGLFSTVLMCTVTGDRQYKVITQSDGTNTCKSPIGMLPETMDNDLLQIDRMIREYYDLAPLGTPVKKEEKKKDVTVTTSATVPGGEGK